MKGFDGYQHTQPGTLMRIILAVMSITFISIAVGLLVAGRDPGQVVGLFVPVGIIAVILALFHSLSVRVTSEMVHLSFGIGLINKTFWLREIESAAVARTRWYHGWGIKKIRGGWLFNVSGFDAVELKLRNGRRYLMGTDEPRKLHEAIESALVDAQSAGG